MKQSIHDGSVTYSVTVPNPSPGTGKHAKTREQAARRHWFFARINRVYKAEQMLLFDLYRMKGSVR